MPTSPHNSRPEEAVPKIKRAKRAKREIKK
jgi:hypothetical protein